MVQITVKVCHKTDFSITSPPANEAGLIILPWTYVEAWALEEKKMFIINYTGLGDYTGDFAVQPMNRDDISRSLLGYARFHEYAAFPERV